MDESFLTLKGRKVCGRDTNKYFGRLSDVLVNKDTNRIIGIISKNDSLIYRHRLFLLSEVTGCDDVCIYVRGFGERFVRVIPVFTDFSSCEDDIFKRKAVSTSGNIIGKIQNIHFDFEIGCIKGFETGFSLAQDLLNGRMFYPIQDTIRFSQGRIVLDCKTDKTEQ